MRVFMKDNCPRIFCGHVQQDEFAIRSGLEKPRNLGRLAVPQRGELAEFFCVAEGDDLKRYRKINLGFYQDRSKNRSQLLELNGASRPRFSPASVTTEKCGDRISTHCGSPASASGTVWGIRSEETTVKTRGAKGIRMARTPFGPTYPIPVLVKITCGRWFVPKNEGDARSL